ncbi:unnamed protein product, partial [Ixodes persulcatus]
SSGRSLQLGLFDIPDLDNMEGDDNDDSGGDGDDEDLEAELSALLTGKSQAKPKKPAPKPAMDLGSIQMMAAAIMKDDTGTDEEDDANLSDDPDLVAELQDLAPQQEDRAPPRPAPRPPPGAVPVLPPRPVTQPAPAPKPSGELSQVEMLQERLQNYLAAEAAAKSAGDTSKVRRFGRAIKTLESLVKKARAGGAVSEEDIPPPVAIPKAASASAPPPAPSRENTSFTPAPSLIMLRLGVQKPPGAYMGPSSSILFCSAATACSCLAFLAAFALSSDLARARAGDSFPRWVNAPLSRRLCSHRTRQQIEGLRRSQFPSKSAIVSSTSGTKVVLRRHRRSAPLVSKSFWCTRATATATNKSPPLLVAAARAHPSGFGFRNRACSVPLAGEGEGEERDAPWTLPSMPLPCKCPQKQKTKKREKETTEVTLAYDDPSLFNAPPPPTSVLEALQQRLEKYQSTIAEAKEKGDDRKVRRLGRIVKQYEDAIKLHKAGKPVDFEELPAPPGFGPIPVPQEAAAPAPKPVPPKPAPKPASRPAPARPAQAAASPATKPGPSAPQKKPLRRGLSTTIDKQMEFLLERQRLFREAALDAKRRGDREQAKEYLRMMKGLDPMIQATEAGLPINATSIPIPPQLQEDFVVVEASECEGKEQEGTDDEAYRTLERELVDQHLMCVQNKDHFFKLGDVSSGTK